MQTLPPPPIMPCIPAAKAVKGSVKSFLVASGDAEQVGEWLKPVRQGSIWKTDADAVSNGVRFVRLTGDGDISYREIGGLVYEAQRRRISINFFMEPPICEAEEK